MQGCGVVYGHFFGWPNAGPGYRSQPWPSMPGIGRQWSSMAGHDGLSLYGLSLCGLSPRLFFLFFCCKVQQWPACDQDHKKTWLRFPFQISYQKKNKQNKKTTKNYDSRVIIAGVKLRPSNNACLANWPQFVGQACKMFFLFFC